jgi:hypothetical protein
MRELVSLAESDRKIALDRYRLLRPHLEDGRALTIASEAGVAYSTAQRWVTLYRRSHKVPRFRCDQNGLRSVPLFRGLEQKFRYLIWLVEHRVMSALNRTNYPGWVILQFLIKR